MAALVRSLSESLWPTAFSLLVGLMALGFYGYLSHRLAICDLEMECATVDLLHYLGHYGQTPVRAEPQISVELVLPDDRSDRRWMLVAFPALTLAFCLEIFHFFGEGVDWGWVFWAASIHVLFRLSLSCIPAQFLWMKFFHRRRGWLIGLGSLFCFCWCLSEILFDVRAF